jgi:hypothetical protein
MPITVPSRPSSGAAEATVSQQMSQNYQKGVDNQQDRQESVQIK